MKTQFGILQTKQQCEKFCHIATERPILFLTNGHTSRNNQIQLTTLFMLEIKCSSMFMIGAFAEDQIDTQFE